MDILKTFTTDKALETHGVNVDIGGGTTLLVARMYNPEYNELLRNAMKPYKRAKLSNDDSLELMIAIEADTILLDWDGVTADGKDVPYTKSAAREYLHVRDFRALVLEIAGNMETFKAQEVAEGEKN